MITYTFVHSTHGNVTASLSPSEALATLASLEASSHSINTPSAARNRANEARALRLAMGRAPMGNVASVVCEPSTFATLPPPYCDACEGEGRANGCAVCGCHPSHCMAS